MKRKLLSIAGASRLLMVAFLPIGCYAQTLAFPGALGFGAQATGGRGGTVYHVTTLNDDGAGSFRDAVSSPNRIIVFDTCGYIALKSSVATQGNLTIAGQTAPGGGIGLSGGELSFTTRSNIICRYIRVRPGSETASTTNDALSLYLSQNVILDHCSFEFAPWDIIDGVGDAATPTTNITFQYCLIADPIGQQFGAHVEGADQWSWFTTIFANSHNRNPLAKDNNVFINNVLYNYQAGYTTANTGGSFKHDIINNYFIFGPAATADNTWFQVDANQSVYASGNLEDKNMDGALNGDATAPGGVTVLAAPWSAISSSVPMYTAPTAYRLAASLSGTFPRDQLDSLIINQIKTLGKGAAGTTAGTAGPGGGLYTSQTQTGLGNNGYGTIQSGEKEPSTNGDGIPDYWKLANNMSLDSDNAMRLESDGYDAIEHYINWLGGFHARTTTGASVAIDLRQYAGGFSDVSPTFAVSNAVNGTAALSSDLHTVIFTPANGFHGLASFNFTVTGTDNSEFSGVLSVAVVPTTAVAAGSYAPHRLLQNRSAVFTVMGSRFTLPEGFRNGTVACSLYDLRGRLVCRTNTGNGIIDIKKMGIDGVYIARVSRY